VQEEKKAKGDGKEEISGKEGEATEGREGGKEGHRKGVNDLPAAYAPSSKSWTRPWLFILELAAHTGHTDRPKKCNELCGLLDGGPHNEYMNNREILVKSYNQNKSHLRRRVQFDRRPALSASRAAVWNTSATPSPVFDEHSA